MSTTLIRSVPVYYPRGFRRKHLARILLGAGNRAGHNTRLVPGRFRLEGVVAAPRPSAGPSSATRDGLPRGAILDVHEPEADHSLGP